MAALLPSGLVRPEPPAGGASGARLCKRYAAAGSVPSLDPGLLLEPANVGRDRLDLPPRDAGHRRHRPEPPVVRPDAALDREDEGRVPVVARLVDGVDERRALVRPERALAVATGTVGVEE